MNALLILSLILALPSEASQVCDLYRSLDAVLQCEELDTFYTNYLNDYGAYYCEKFNRYGNTLNETDPKRLFIEKTTSCLQEALLQKYRSSQLSCQNLETITYASHTQCYSKNNFCSLSRSDQAKIGNVALKRELRNRPLFALRQAIRILKLCR